ncbi:MAG: class B sortase [Eggerthellaceae bacterium]|jgi:sortase B
MSGARRPHRMSGGTAALCAGIVMLSALLALTVAWFSMRGVYSAPAGYHAASEVSDTLQGEQKESGSETADTDDAAYPEIDWSYWQGINPDVVAWITIPDTPVDFPVAYAPEKSSDYYLEHDVYGNFNYFGCIFADPVCPDGLDSRNCILYGHNMSWDDSMFGPLEQYVNRTFAEGHRTVLIQTPEYRRAYFVCAVMVVNGATEEKHTSFADNAAFRRWWKATYEAADLRLNASPLPAEQVLTLCTCSYYEWDNERTLVYAIPQR